MGLRELPPADRGVAARDPGGATGLHSRPVLHLGTKDRRPEGSDFDDAHHDRDDRAGDNLAICAYVIDVAHISDVAHVRDVAHIRAAAAIYLGSGDSIDRTADPNGHTERGSRRGASVDTGDTELVRAIRARCRARLACRDDHP